MFYFKTLSLKSRSHIGKASQHEDFVHKMELTSPPNSDACYIHITYRWAPGKPPSFLSFDLASMLAKIAKRHPNCLSSFKKASSGTLSKKINPDMQIPIFYRSLKKEAYPKMIDGHPLFWVTIDKVSRKIRFTGHHGVIDGKGAEMFLQQFAIEQLRFIEQKYIIPLELVTLPFLFTKTPKIMFGIGVVHSLVKLALLKYTTGDPKFDPFHLSNQQQNVEEKTIRAFMVILNPPTVKLPLTAKSTDSTYKLTITQTSIENVLKKCKDHPLSAPKLLELIYNIAIKRVIGTSCLVRVPKGGKIKSCGYHATATLTKLPEKNLLSLKDAYTSQGKTLRDSKIKGIHMCVCPETMIEIMQKENKDPAVDYCPRFLFNFLGAYTKLPAPFLFDRLEQDGDHAHLGNWKYAIDERGVYNPYIQVNVTTRDGNFEIEVKALTDAANDIAREISKEMEAIFDTLKSVDHPFSHPIETSL